jgi:hypothetical protein
MLQVLQGGKGGSWLDRLTSCELPVAGGRKRAKLPFHTQHLSPWRVQAGLPEFKEALEQPV